MKRNALIFLALLAAAGAVWVALAVSGPGEKPNFLLITLDTTRADHLGCYGDPKSHTPRIDRLAREGVRFDLAVAQAAITPVSHASILTGLYPFQHGLRVLHGASNFCLEKGAYPTLASLFQERGWKTAAFVSAFPVSEYFGLDAGFNTFDTGITENLDEIMKIDEEGKANWSFDRNQRRADATTDLAIDWLKNNSGSFFLWLHFFDPHDLDLKPPAKFYRRFLGDAKKRMEVHRRMYAAEVAFMDLQIGRLFDFLDRSGRYDNTCIVLTNDHGQGLGNHDWWGHRILYQEQIRMPLIVRFPEGPRNRTVPDLVRSIDIAPTMLQYAGIEIPPMAGKSLMGLMEGKAEPERTAYADALIRLDDNRPDSAEGIYNDLLYCVMTRDWKLIHRHFNPKASELYRLDQDPNELYNVIDQYPEKRDELFEFLEIPGVMIEKLIPRGSDNEAMERLNQLGYHR